MLGQDTASAPAQLAQSAGLPQLREYVIGSHVVYKQFSKVKQPTHLRKDKMEHMIKLHIEKLPEGVYLAASDDIQG